MTLRVIVFLTYFAAITARGQVLIKTPEWRYPADTAVLQTGELRTDLTCKVSPVQPELGFDLKFHSGYDVTVPMAELVGIRNELTAIFRVVPQDHPDQETYFPQSWKVPEIAGDARGTVNLQGRFDLGEGRYRVEWLMRDRDEKYCSAHWQISADHPRGKGGQIEFRLPRGRVTEEATEPYASEDPVQRDPSHPLHVDILFHVASQSAGASGMSAKEADVALSILRKIAREPRIGSYSITAFNMERREIVFRRDDELYVDFPALGKAIRELQLGTINVKALEQNHSDREFLSQLLAEQLTSYHADALIFVGPKARAEFKVSDKVKAMAAPSCPVFYLNYNVDPIANPWRDAIGSVVKLWKGFEYTITRPRDMFAAWSEVMTTISSSNAALRRGVEPEESDSSRKIRSGTRGEHR